MRTRHLAGICALTSAIGAMAFGCSVETKVINGDGDGGSGAGTSGNPTSTVSVSSSAGVGGGSGGGSGETDSCANPLQTISLDQNATGQISPDEDYDYYRFSGTAGQALAIFTEAKPDEDPFAEGYVDMVLTIFNEDGEKVGENDDPIPRNTQDSELFTVLPADGDYCIRIGHFCHWSEEDQGVPCPSPQPITNPNYGFIMTEIDFTATRSVSESLDEDELGYEMGNNGYFGVLVHGTFDDGDDVDSYAFNLPDDITISQGRATANFDMFPAGGEEGNGSSAPTGKIWLTTADDTETVLAEIDTTKYEPTFGMTLSFPADLDADYVVNIAGDGGSNVGNNPFYYFFHSFGGSNIPEAEEGTGSNDISDDAESNVEFIGNSTGGFSGAFVEGNLPGGTDVDWFKFPIADFGVTPDSTWTISGACSAQRIGSGLRVLNLTLEDQEGSEIHSANETPDESASFGDGGKAFPSGTVTDLLLKVSAGSLDDNVEGDYYRCGVVLVPPDA